MQINIALCENFPDPAVWHTPSVSDIKIVDQTMMVTSCMQEGHGMMVGHLRARCVLAEAQQAPGTRYEPQHFLL